jgi:hypothetical protein
MNSHRDQAKAYRVGEVKNPKVELAVSIGASPALPPVLSSVELDLNESDHTLGSGMDLHRPPFTTQIVLTKGGVYDHLGLDTVSSADHLRVDPHGRASFPACPHADNVTPTLHLAITQLQYGCCIHQLQSPGQLVPSPPLAPVH